MFVLEVCYRSLLFRGTVTNVTGDVFSSSFGVELSYVISHCDCV